MTVTTTPHLQQCIHNNCSKAAFPGRARCLRHLEMMKAADTKRARAAGKKEKPRRELPRDTYIGIDGEGQGRLVHRYVMLAAASEDGQYKWVVENKNGLSTEECLDFILSLPIHRVFAYAFNYDLTKILEDLDNESLYLLFRPELRKQLGAIQGLAAVRWKDYRINLQGTRFTVKREGAKIVIWDVFKFFQSKFTKALLDWKVGDPEHVKWMAKMKDLRSDFDKLSRTQILEYCHLECRYMGELARKLVDAHADAGLVLKSFYGAGSTGGAILTKMGLKDEIKRHPDKMDKPVSCAFFGGRFENLYIGEIQGEIWNYDISSAYPYQLCFLPCLKHGSWTHASKRKTLDGKRAALVRYRLHKPDQKLYWGPFPFREKDGSICFPAESGGGWVWLDEYLQGEKMFPNVEFIEAWVYNSKCKCQPFKDIPNYYRERLRIGKEGPGIVIKLGTNSCYGKLAQSVGKAIFNSWIWAGMITSGCRAQLLEAMAQHTDLRNLLMVATDGIYTRERLKLAKPKDTGTWDCIQPIVKKGITQLDSKGKILYEQAHKPLGGWEEKECKAGLFLARPGVYFPPNVTEEDAEKIRARGIGRSVLLNNRETIINAWRLFGMDQAVKVTNVSRFCGAKTSISKGETGYTRGYGLPGTELPAYGQWIDRTVSMTFNPMPKRLGLDSDGTLEIRSLDPDVMSAVYKRSVISTDAAILKESELMTIEQPDFDYQEFYTG